jgi:phospholipase C
LNPGSVIVGSAATSTITVTPANGYTGSVSLSCKITGGGTPAPTCALGPSSVTIGGAAAVTSTMTVSTTSGTVGGSYTVTVTGSDASNLAPSNGPQALNLKIPTPSFTLGAKALNPASVSAGGTSTSTITVTPVNGYTGSVSLSCSSVTGATPLPTCAFNASPIVISGTLPGTSTLTVTTAASTPDASAAITVTGSDTNNSAPSNGPQALALTTLSRIQHVVIIFQENRTPDNLFQGLCLPPNSASSCSTSPTASQYDIASSGVNSSGQTIQLSPIDLGTTNSNGNPDEYDPSHTHLAFQQMCDLNTTTNTCAMDGADKIFVGCNEKATNCPPPNAQFMYVYPEDVQPYLTLAQTYAFADHMFQTNQGPSFPAHQFILSATSAPSVDSTYFVAEDPTGVPNASTNTGCTAPLDETVDQIDPSTGVETPIFPCFEHPTLTDLLDAANLSWHYYAPTAGYICTAPNAIEHMCGSESPNSAGCSGPDWTAVDGGVPKIVLNQTQANAQVLTDIKSNQLQGVSWVIPAGQFSDHALSNTGCGPSWVTQVVNQVGNSPYWSNTVIILAWDDWGGWYDHVPPSQMLNSYEYGFRVPMIVISPYAKAAYISHANHDFGSILKYIETNFNLPSLGYADATADDLSDIFNFTQTPPMFQSITPPSDTTACINDPSPPGDPDDDN